MLANPEDTTVKLPPKLLAAALEGRKRQHRIPRRSDQPQDCRHRRGHTIRLERETGEIMGTAIITSVTQATLGDVGPREAKLEGHKNPEKFLETWAETHGDASPDRKVWVVEIQLIEQPRLLVPATRPAGVKTGSDPELASHGYTDAGGGMPGEPEAVDPSTVAMLGVKARERHAHTTKERQRRQQAISLARQLNDETVRSERAGLDTSDHLAQMQHTLNTMRKERLEAMRDQAA